MRPRLVSSLETRKRDGGEIRITEGGKTLFGELLTAHLHDAGMTQQDFADAMQAHGYPGEGVGPENLRDIMHHTATAGIYQNFFLITQQTLDLTDEERDTLIKAWGLSAS